MTATVRFTITKPHDVTLRVRAVAVDDGSVQHEQEFAAGSCECMSDEFVVHAGVMLEVFEGEARQSIGGNAARAALEEIAKRDASVRELEQQAAHKRIANAEEKAAHEALQEQLKTAQVRITELESANAAAQARAVKQRGK